MISALKDLDYMDETIRELIALGPGHHCCGFLRGWLTVLIKSGPRGCFWHVRWTTGRMLHVAAFESPAADFCRDGSIRYVVKSTGVPLPVDCQGEHVRIAGTLRKRIKQALRKKGEKVTEVAV